MKTKNMVISALLCALGIVIPMFFPKIVLPPASFTLASHVPIFIAMMLSPSIAVTVAIGTTFGFLLSGLPIIVVLRAFTHVLFATIGAIWYKNHKPLKTPALILWALVVSVIHGLGEFVVVTAFYFGGNIQEGYYSNGYFISVVLLVLLGTIVHSMVDFAISYAVCKALKIIPKEVIA
ncbi:MAG: hypothetical protein RSD67_07405 [Oscillospiraceae bacterium]